MSKPTGRDQVWHAALVAAIENERFGVDDVEETGESLNVEASQRTAWKVLNTMVEFGYLIKVDRGSWRLDPGIAIACASKLVREEEEEEDREQEGAA